MDNVVTVKCSKIRYLDEDSGTKYPRSVSVKISRDFLEACAGEKLDFAELDSDPDFADAVKDAVEEAVGESVDRLTYKLPL